jgi:ABC-type dipeptide/oligopeptide/nickel transport system permease subunit
LGTLPLADADVATQAKMQPAAFVVFWRRFSRNRLAVFGLGLVAVVVLVAVFAPWLAPHNATAEFISAMPLDGAPLKPTWHMPFFLGTDGVGHDELSQLIYGARVSMEVGVMATFISLLIGVAVGVVAGYLGGWADNLLMRLTDIMLAFPIILFVILIDSVVAERTVATVFTSIGILAWPGIARIARGQTLSIAKNEYVDVARSLGASPLRIMLLHILPNVLSPVLVYGTLQIANNILLESALSFLGAGVPDPIPSWGKMLSASIGYYLVDPYLLIWPGVALALATLGFNLVGDGLNDAMNPRSAQL